MSDEFRLSDLNDYCLLLIINFLDLRSKLKLHVSCKRFNRLIIKWFSHQLAFGDLRCNTIKLCTKKEHNIDEYQYSLKSLTESTSNNQWNLNIMMLTRLFQLSQRIECIHFNCLDDENLMSEKLIITLIGTLPNITCLSFGLGLHISSKCWNSITRQLGNQLQHLQINRVNSLTLENIVKYCPNLISLYIRFCPSACSCLSYLWPKLKRLRIQSMATIYLLNADFIHRNRRMNFHGNDDDEETINLDQDNSNNNNNVRINMNSIHFSNGNQMDLEIIPNNSNNFYNLINQAESYINTFDKIWYLNLVELRLNRITVKSLVVIFNHCINLQVLDLVLLFTKATLVFENQNFIQLAHRLFNMRLFALDVCSKWSLVQLDKGLALIFSEWSKMEVIIIKRGFITEYLFERIKNDCNNLKVICVEFCDYVPYNHRINEITDRVVDSLIELKKLTKLRLHFTGITDNGFVKLIENCRNLKYLDLFGCVKITDKSLLAISTMLNKANKCNAMVSSPLKSDIKIEKNLENLSTNCDIESKFKSKKQKLVKSISIRSNYHNQSNESIQSDSKSCKRFDSITAFCADCGKKPQTFYLTIRRTKIDLMKTNIKPPNTLFIINEDNEIWNSYNYFSE